MSDYNDLAQVISQETRKYYGLDVGTGSGPRAVYVADVLWAAGWRKKPSATEVRQWVSANFAVSNGTQVWVEFQGSIDGFTDAILALMDGPTEKGAGDVG